MYLQVLGCVLGYLGAWVLGHVLGVLRVTSWDELIILRVDHIMYSQVLGCMLGYLGTWVLGYVLGVLQVILCDELITSKFAIFQMSHNWKHSYFLQHSSKLIHTTRNLIQLESSENNLISETCEKCWITGVKILNFREMQKGTKMIVTDNLTQQNGYSKWLSTLLLGSETGMWESKTWWLTWMLMLHK